MAAERVQRVAAPRVQSLPAVSVVETGDMEGGKDTVARVARAEVATGEETGTVVVVVALQASQEKDQSHPRSHPNLLPNHPKVEEDTTTTTPVHNGTTTATQIASPITTLQESALPTFILVVWTVGTTPTM